jgi:Tol biopolymer transport system component
MRRRTEGIFALGLIAATAPAWAAGTTTRVSVSSGGAQGNEESTYPSVSADGRFVAFVSDATNLVPGDTNRATDVFVRDRVAGTTTRVSVSSGGAQGNFGATAVAISTDGRFVVFGSAATNLVPRDTNGVSDVFVRDRVAGTTTRVNLGAGGAQANDHSGHLSQSVAISADGRVVAFSSYARNLVPGGDTNQSSDIFVRDRVAGTTTRASVGPGGAQANLHSFHPSLSADGRVVAFYSEASNLVRGDTNGVSDIFARDRVAGTTARVSLATGGAQGNRPSGRVGLAISASGRVVAFESDATNLVPGDTNGDADIFVRDRLRSTTTRVSVGAGGVEGDWFSANPSISADGRVVAFMSGADNLVPGDGNGRRDVFVRDRAAGTTTRVSLATGGGHANAHSGQAGVAISGDGRVVAFQSDATNLVPGDSNGVSDVFVRER